MLLIIVVIYSFETLSILGMVIVVIISMQVKSIKTFRAFVKAHIHLSRSEKNFSTLRGKQASHGLVIAFYSVFYLESYRSEVRLVPSLVWDGRTIVTLVACINLFIISTET